MKSTLAALCLLTSAPALGATLSGETLFYTVNLKGDYKRETGYELWRGKKEGAMFKLLLEEEMEIKRGARFKLSVTSGSTKNPWNGLFTPQDNRLSEWSFKKTTVRELYLKKEHFIFKRLTLTAGKQLFEVGPVIRDYLWGGTFTYRLGGGATVTWKQIAAYEGRYLLFGTKSEDDIDIFALEVKKGRVSLGLYRIMDAKGELPAVSKGGFLLGFKGKRVEFKGATQNGKTGGYLVVKLLGGELQGGYAQKGFTSYGFKEGVSGIGLIYRPTFSDLRFLKWVGELPLGNLSLKLHALRLESSTGSFIGNELGGEAALKVKGGELFLRGALGSGSSYALFSGVRWRVGEGFPLPKELNVKTESQFSIIGEYADLPQRPYTTQNSYYGWESARHIGYWHSTYKLGVSWGWGRFKVSTGPNTKIDYLIWGNTDDSLLYRVKEEKEWHLEEAYLRGRGAKLGLMEVEAKGLFKESFTGLNFGRGPWELYLLSTDRTLPQEEVERAQVALGKVKVKWGEAFFLYRNGEGSSTAAGLSIKGGALEAGGVKEVVRGKGEWGGYVEVKGELFKFKQALTYRVYSKGFTAFNFKEYFWNEGYILKPGESNVRLLKYSAQREFKTGLKRVDRLKPKVAFKYLKLNLFNGKYIAEEGGVEITVKPGRRCTFSLIGMVGSHGSYYQGVAFKARW